jgi:recombination protein RecR
VEKLPESIERVVSSFSMLPGVGSKTALRQVMNMVNWSKEDLLSFSDSVRDLTTLKFCNDCGFFSEKEKCYVCSNEKRLEGSSLCVVETINDFMAIERSHQFSGVYHILGGVLNPLLGVGPEKLNLDKLEDRIKKLNIKNIILAVNPSVEGDATCAYIRQLIGQHVSIERIGFGMPMGGSLEYLDSLTISKALENRKSL